jgi:competence protein ComEC
MCGLLFFTSIFLYSEIIKEKTLEYARAYFLDVGQGDSELFLFPDGTSFLIDGGPWNGKLQSAIETANGKTKRYIDAVAITHPEEDHFGGLVDIINSYNIGVFLWNGREAETSDSFKEFLRHIKEKKIPIAIMREGGSVLGKEFSIKILNPSEEMLIKKTNETSLVFLLESKGMDVLVTGDIGKETEEYILQLIKKKIDILKVSHHGSKYSSSELFLRAIQPIFSVIEVGKNSYGHPAPETLKELKEIGSKIFRTDASGTIEFRSDGKKIQVIE